MRRARLWSFVALAAAALVWVVFLDSHSLYRRLRWEQERTQLDADTRAMQAEIERLSRELPRAAEPEVVERLAREQYGMRRPGETVYRVETPPEGN